MFYLHFQSTVIIYVSAVSAYIIPIKAFNSIEEKNSFINLAKTYV
ncbi:hypothetical protein DOT_0507 [Desulfosporosinus sp. OT]|nr:hypothetical protein DOT_0507 [Desulfosporosinus sp. OT]